MHTVTPDQSVRTSSGGGGAAPSAGAPGAPHGPPPWSRSIATASAGVTSFPRATHARVAASRWSAMRVGTWGDRRSSQSASGATSDDDRTQPVDSVSRFEMAAPSATGWATQARPEVSTTQPPRPSITRNDDQ